MRRKTGFLAVVSLLVGFGLASSGCELATAPETCPRGWVEVEDCPENARCKHVGGDDELLCKKLTCETEPECPPETDDVEVCRTDERCFLQKRCDDAVMCKEDDPRPCDNEPECPDESERVSTCPKDELCFSVRRCGTEITCQDNTAR